VGRAVTSIPRPGVAQLWLITPVFNEEENLERLVEVVTRTIFSRADLDAHLLFVDDGSSDTSWTIIEKLCAQNPRFEGIRLSRNFGSHTALSAGFNRVGDVADVVATLACDLQDPPEIVVQFVERWRVGADIVWGERSARHDSRWRVLASRLFEALLRRFAMPKGSRITTGSFFLADRRVVAAYREMREHNRITFALFAWTGFDQERVPYERAARQAGISGWPLRAMLKTMYDAFIGFSTVPIKLIKVAAWFASLLSIGLIIYLLTLKTVHSTVPGWTSQLIVLSTFFAIQFTLTGMMGEYLSRLYTEAVKRPLYFISASTSPQERPESVT